ncbi:hypothetical protein CSA56_15090 [candidate division KSB3 bacterium]|uniref:Beta-mannosidase B n=1 Tax=candidate division KSB3 bacterium TaxID=2044937 RepID=A0A2G6KA08_9BACT|nr:MAG: hypothetical protein CSA56_15090 [candidate division KSB3 bacterium]
MKYFDLCGSWTVRQKNGTETIAATVPGCIHTDLLHAGKIDDPYYRDNEDSQMWIGETDWIYSRSFTVAQAFLAASHIVLHCDGLDTLATITINGKEIGKADNQFRAWEFDVKPSLRVGENTIEICFDSTIPLITRKQEERYLNLTGVGHHRIDGSNYIRKSQCNYGWDWGPMCATAGIWRPLALLAYDTARIDATHITQDHTKENLVGLHIAVSVEQEKTSDVMARVIVLDEGTQVCQTEAVVKDGVVEIDCTVEDPELWWPNGMGEQHLYDVRVELTENNDVIDDTKKQIGLRTLVLDRHEDEWGESFQFVVNGKPFFAKGANWIPADTFVTNIAEERYEYLIKSAADAHMNMLRVWGGGIYEDDVFYELCDHYGICIWQDFMFACSAYPAFDEDYMANVTIEAEQTVKRLRHHPCLALWCGNNELEQIDGLVGAPDETGVMSWNDYKALFDVLLPDIVKRCDPERDYWPSSPHSPTGERTDWNNPKWGDAHLWQVWHGRQPFEWYRTCEHRFNSEFGFQSFPEPEVVKSYTLPEDRNITSYIMEWHQRSQIGNDAIMQYMLSWFKLPTTFDHLLWLSQVLQGLGMKYAVEHWRRSMPRGMGTLYWQLNDCWPVASWSSIDYPGNWKALHYMARDFFAPLLVSAIEDPRVGIVEVHATSDLLEDTSGAIHWMLTDTGGNMLAENTLGCSKIAASADTKVCELKFADHLQEYGNRCLLLWLELLLDNKVVSRNFVTFNRPKHLVLHDPELAGEVREVGKGDFIVSISAQRPALWVWPDLPGVHASYSERFFHLRPEQVVEVLIHPEHHLSLDEFKKTLTLSSLVDTFQSV